MGVHKAVIGLAATLMTFSAHLLPGSAQEHRVLRDLEYARAGDLSLQLDLYLPDSGGPHPLIVWMHGGAFRVGDKGRIWWGPIVRQTERGYAMASINYRLSGQAVFPALVHDAKAAIQWLRANAGKYNLQADRIVVAGESAGGYLAAMLGTTGGVAALEHPHPGHPGQSNRVQGVVDFFGPTDFLQMDDGVPRACEAPQVHRAPDSPESQLLGCNLEACSDRVNEASPITYVDGDDPPFLILHGTGDCTVPSHQSQLLYDALSAVGVPATLQLFPTLGHADRRFFTHETEQLVSDFIDAVLRSGSTP